MSMVEKRKNKEYKSERKKHKKFSKNIRLFFVCKNEVEFFVLV